MSRAFVREDGPTRWEPTQRAAYQVRFSGEVEVLKGGNDLLALLHWLESRSIAGLELRDGSGLLLAKT